MTKALMAIALPVLLAASSASAKDYVLKMNGIESIKVGDAIGGKIPVTVEFSLDCIDRFKKIVLSHLDEEITPGSVAMAVGVLIEHPELKDDELRCLGIEHVEHKFTLPEAPEGYDLRPIQP
jgi:hypothetical protein